MKAITNLTSFMVIFLCFSLCGCKDIVRTRYVPPAPIPPRSVTLKPSTNVLDDGITLNLRNLTKDDLQLNVTEGSPFTVELVAGENDRQAKVTITPTVQKGSLTTDFDAIVKVCGLDGTEYAEWVCPPDIIYKDWRKFKVKEKDYEFDLMKMFHFDGTNSNFSAVNTAGYAVLLTAGDVGDVSEKDSVITVKNSPSSKNEGTRIVFVHDSKWNKDTYDYAEIKFRSAPDQATQLALIGENDTVFFYDKGELGVMSTSSPDSTQDYFTSLSSCPDTADVATTYSDASDDWVTVGFFNDTTQDDGTVLISEDYTAQAVSFDGTKGFAFNTAWGTASKGYTYLCINSSQATTEIDYIAFFKKK